MAEENGDNGDASPNGDWDEVRVSSPVPTTPAKPARKPNDRIADMQLGRCPYVRLHDNVNYVAAALVLRGSGSDIEVLLIQEAKKSCYGKWYMPAGRVEAGETVENAARRELKEETGYFCDVVELLSLQVQGSGWYRFAFYCTVLGGDLKTKPDAESLSAQWFPLKDVRERKITFRGKDFLKLVDEAVSYHKRGRDDRIPPVLVEPINQRGLSIEFMIYRRNIDGSKTEVFVHRSIADEEALASHDQPFPTVDFGFEYFFAMVVSKCYRHLIEDGPNVLFSPTEITRVKCHPAPMESLQHGIAVRVACPQKGSILKANARSPSRYHWILVENEETLVKLRLKKDQYRPSLHML